MMPYVDTKDILSILDEVVDPEIPVISIRDLGVLRSIESIHDMLRIVITPTYSGCPAMHMIEQMIKLKLAEHGITNYEIVTQLSPAWTTDWLSESGRQKLASYGIAPPNASSGQSPKNCPRCGSAEVRCISEFGSTACKSLWKCLECLEPFDYFKCH